MQAIGAGGMGQVYRARDTRLNRTVAIKVLTPEFAARPDWKQRFEREARTIASLNHPHICTLHDVGLQDGIDFLVMEYLEGQTLAQRLERGALPLAEALKVAIEIADALDKAHVQGIVHRDLKPANVMLTKSGVKLLDFGLAKPKRTSSEEVHNSNLPTAGALSDVTAEGTILGTLKYMSPEQLENMDADSRSDIFAFGAVLYEMITGRKAFDGRSQSSVIGSILHVNPPAISSLRSMTPRVLDRVVQTCLAKDPQQRWQSAHDLALQLQWIAEGGSEAGVPSSTVPQRRNRERLSWIVASVAVGGCHRAGAYGRAALRTSSGSPDVPF
jgi:serine/threonine protein kinase